MEPPHYIRQYLYSLNRWERVPQFVDLSELWEYDPNQVAGEVEQDGFDLPLNSNLKITGHKSVTVELNKTHYFGQTDRYSFYGMNSGYSSSYNSGLDLGLNSSYGDSYSSYGNYGGGYDSFSGGGGFGGSSYGGYGSGFSMSRGGAPRASGINIRQTLQVGLHGRVGEHTHVEVD